MEQNHPGLQHELFGGPMSIFEKTEKRKCFIGLFDILGFKNRIHRKDHDDNSKLMVTTRKHIKNIENIENKKTGLINTMRDFKNAIRVILFSDTILFVSESGSVDCFWKLIVYTANFFIRMLLEGIPLKGALSFGEMTTNFTESIYFGRPLVDAHLLSEESYFCGAVIHHSIQKYCEEQKLSYEDHFLKSDKIPMKTGEIMHHYIDLISFSKEQNIIEFKKDNIQRLYLNVSGPPRKYVDNTLSVYFPD